MKLAAESHKYLEDFHRHHSSKGELRLPPVYLHAGRFARLITHTFKIAAITFGRHILVKPELVVRDEAGRLRAPSWLIAHETTHVLQYDRAVFVGFLWAYLKDYWRTRREQQGWRSVARMSEYLSIGVARDAREAEHRFAEWNAREKSRRDAGQFKSGVV